MAVAQQIPWARPDFYGREQEYVAEALRSTWISGGEFVERLEREVGAFLGLPHALTSSNGTTSIHMAYLGLGLGAGDEIVVPGFAFMAAANVALHVGATPVFADVDPDTWCITAADVERCLTPRTRAIVPVHTYGNVCDMDPITELARARGIAVIEDVAEAFASRYRGRFAGTMCDVASLSFQATKTITTGEGGMVLTADPALHARMALYRSHGMLHRRYWHELPGHNFRLTNLQAAIGCAQMEALPEIIVQRKRVHARYIEELGTVDGVVLQRFADDVDPVLWAIALRLDPRAFPQGRDAVIDALKQDGIETRPGFYAASEMKHLYRTGPLPASEAVAASAISLPTYPTLEDEQIAAVCGALKTLRR